MNYKLLLLVSIVVLAGILLIWGRESCKKELSMVVLDSTTMTVTVRIQPVSSDETFWRSWQLRDGRWIQTGLAPGGKVIWRFRGDKQ